MKTPTWRSKFQTDAENVKFTTRLTSLLISRFFLHVWLSLKAVWRYGLLRSLLLLPILFLRALFFPLQWPISLAGNSIVSFCRWITDKPLMAFGRALHMIVTVPIQAIADVGENARMRACDAGMRFLHQYRELCELGFVNAMALMPFLIIRLIQGALLSIFAAIVGFVLLCWKGICACGSALLTALLWLGSWFSLSGSWNWVKAFYAGFITRLAASPLVLWLRAVLAGSGQFFHSLLGRSISWPKLPDWAGWSAFTRSFREQTAWVVVTITGTLGLLLLLYIQWTSASTATAGLPSQNIAAAINAQERDDHVQIDDDLPIDNGQQEPSVWSGNDDPDPFASFPESEKIEPVRTPDPEPRTFPPADPFEQEGTSPTKVADDESTPAEFEKPAKRIFNPFTDLRPRKQTPAPPIQARITEPQVEEPEADLNLSVSWLPREVSFDNVPDNQFVVKTQIAPLDFALLSARENDGWQEFDPTSVKPAGQPAAARMQLDRPDLLVRSESVEREIQPADVTTDSKDLDLAISRDFPETATLDGLVSYRIRVKNRGSKTVDRVRVEDRLPKGSRVVQTSPVASLVEGALVWQLDTIQPNEELTLQVDIIPTIVGSTENVVIVRPVAAVVAQTQVGESVAPALQLEVAAPFRVATGDDCVIQFKVTNPGNQHVDNVILRAELPDGLQHPDGHRLDYMLGSLKAGESRYVVLATQVKDIGNARCRFHLLTNDEVVQTSLATVQTIKASTAALTNGSRRRSVSPPCNCKP